MNALHELFGLEAALAPPGAEVTRLSERRRKQA